MNDLTALEIADAVRTGRLAATVITEAALARVAAHDPKLNAFTDLMRERALEEAARIDRIVAAGGDPGPLAGVPFAVKNLFDIQGLSTRAGSRINLDRPPAAVDATSIRRLNDAGAVLLGALNMGEYAYDFTGENCHYGASRNPHDPSRMSGGSSGGSATAVASGMVPFALGSDTNGSVRVPSSLCGLFGLKPTFGRLSRAGVFPFCASLDHVGVLARSVADLAAIYDVMQGPDPADPACAGRPPEPPAPMLGRGADGLRIAVAGGYFEALADGQALDAVARAAAALGARRRVEIPQAAIARSAAYLITATEAASLHRGRLRTRPMDFDPDVRDRFFAGSLTPAAWYVQAQRFRRWYHRQVMALFDDIDVIIAPATPCAAPAIGQRTFVVGGETLLVRANLGVFTQPISFIGLPVVAAPVRQQEALPIGVQIIAAPWREEDALRVAGTLERAGVCVAPVAMKP